jgi:hypothetical protein
VSTETKWSHHTGEQRSFESEAFEESSREVAIWPLELPLAEEQIFLVQRSDTRII